MKTLSFAGFAAGVLGLALATACGGSSTQGSGSAGSNSVTVSLGSGGPTPKDVIINPNGRVTFANVDTKAHTLKSQDCAFLNLGPIQPGELLEVSLSAEPVTCHYQMAEGGSQGTLTVASHGDAGT